MTKNKPITEDMEELISTTAELIKVAHECHKMTYTQILDSMCVMVPILAELAVQEGQTPEASMTKMALLMRIRFPILADSMTIVNEENAQPENSSLQS